MDTMFDKLEKQNYYLIAEIGVNYYDIAKKENLSLLDAAKRMCLEALRAGADAVKFQTYKADKIASVFSPSYWDTNEEPTRSQYELFQKYDSFGEKEYHELASYCEAAGILFLSTPFDFECADYLDPFMDYYKISSSDITNLPFIRHINAKKKPILLSTGASTEQELDIAVNEILQSGNRLILMHCVLEYPTPEGHANLGRITALKNKYPDIEIGYSDHTKPLHCYDVLKAAYLLGARVIEKHFTLDKTLPGNDHYHAMDPHDLAQIKSCLEYLKTVVGAGGLSFQESERPARKNARRSIVLTHSLAANTVITEKDITYKRPGSGISPSEYEQIIGKRVKQEMPADSVLQWSDLI